MLSNSKSSHLTRKVSPDLHSILINVVLNVVFNLFFGVFFMSKGDLFVL